ncbi:EAL domain-containing protein [Synechococcus moorigangaii CMS01]|nr:EAL domain-containing protein [Synechococcus moorigangaii CMS01]
MSAPLIQLHPGDSLAIAQEKLQRHQVRRIVVTGKAGELQGILTESNLSQILDPLELFGMLEILQHRVKQLSEDRDRLLPHKTLHLQQALKNGEFLLYYQPQLDTDSDRIVGAEVLVRWRSPERGLVSPGEFIPLAEMTGFIVPLGEWILKAACTQAIQWQQRGLPPLQISVNLSSKQLQSPQLVPCLKAILAETGLAARWLKLELTESALVENVDFTMAQFRLIKELGVAIAIDDFGTGYASLGYLQHFPFDTLKIDRCFVENIHQNPKNAAITKALINMAQQLNFSVVAEGVETAAEMEFLRQHDCHTFQGFFISRPLPLAAFEAFVQNYPA